MKLNIEFSPVNILAIICLIWLISGFVICSCCEYTLADTLKLAYYKLWSYVGDADEIKIVVEDIKKRNVIVIHHGILLVLCGDQNKQRKHRVIKIKLVKKNNYLDLNQNVLIKRIVH